jgi:hypothetical protein
MSQDEELPKKLHDWLGKQGYPLEMRVARAFNAAGFRTMQSHYYADADTGVSREVDVVADLQSGIAEDLFVRCVFIIECKVSLDKPWVLFSIAGRSLGEPARILQRVLSKTGRQVLFELVKKGDLLDAALFGLQPPLGYGLIQAFTDKTDVAFSAMSTAAKAAKAWVAETDNSSYSPRFIDVVFPVIVMDGRLFQTSLNSASEVIVSETDCATVLWRNPLADLPHTIIHVQVASSIDKFASQLFVRAREFVDKYCMHIYRTWREIPSDKGRK